MRSDLTPRERVLLALSHRGTDRIPVDFLATPETWAGLQEYLGAADPDTLLQDLGADLRHPRQPYIGPRIEERADGSWVDPWGVRRKRIRHDRGAYDEIVEHPLAGLRDLAELERYPWPRPDWWDAAGLAAEIRRLESRGSYAIALPEFGDPGGVFEIAWYLRGMEQFLVDLIERPEWAWEIMRRVTDFYVEMLDRVMAAAGGHVDLVWTSDDIAHQHGSLLSPGCWQTMVAPHHERLNRRIHEHGARVMYHCCGAVRPFVPGLARIGVDVLDVLQFSAAKMDPREIKQAFGETLCFHGGMDVQSTLPAGTPEEVRRVTQERIDVLGRDGGYILAPTHNIQIDTPPANIVAMYAQAGSLGPRLRQE